MSAEQAFEIYLFTKGNWRLHQRLGESDGGRDRAIRLAEVEFAKPWVEGAMVVREAFDPDSQTFSDTKVFRRVKRPDLPTLGGTQRMGGGRPVAAPTSTAPPRPAATAVERPTQSKPRRSEKAPPPAPKKDDRSLLTLLSGLASKVVGDTGATAATTTAPKKVRPADGEQKGVRIGRYDIISELGKGAMGVVYKAYDPVIDRLVAIKTINKQMVDETGDALSRLRREAQSAGRLSHPNIVAIYDYGENQKFAYIAMEYIDGRPLSVAMAQSPPSLAESLGIMRQVLAALDYSHERKVVHRDIKPANIMLMADGTVKITDFGIARLESSTMTQTGAFMGTPAYMSPEQVKGLVADARSDLFSAAVVLFEMLSGQRPFSGAGASLVYQILHSEPTRLSELNSKVPPALQAVVEKGMAKDPEARFATAREFLGALDDVIDSNRSVSAKQPDTTSQKKAWYERWTFEAGREIFREGDAGDACYVIETGAVEVFKRDPVSGQEIVLATVGRGAVFGEMALIDNQPRMAGVRAKEDTVALMIPRDSFQGRLEKLDPVTRRLLDTFTQRIRSLSDEVVRLSNRGDGGED